MRRFILLAASVIALSSLISDSASAARVCRQVCDNGFCRTRCYNEGPSVYIGRDRDEYRGRSYYREREYRDRRPGIGIETPGFDIRVR
jgi:hypothetical protein